MWFASDSRNGCTISTSVIKSSSSGIGMPIADGLGKESMNSRDRSGLLCSIGHYQIYSIDTEAWIEQ